VFTIRPRAVRGPDRGELRGDERSRTPAASSTCPCRTPSYRLGRTQKPSMANTSDVAAAAAVPSNADIERAAEFAREPFLLDGEGPEALAPGTARRRALDAALRELDEGAEHPSIEWRRNFS